MTLIGAIGGILLALSGIPQAWHCYRRGNSDGLSWGLLAMWLVGETLMLLYALVVYPDDWRLLLNYGANAALVAVMVRYKLRPRWEPPKQAQFRLLVVTPLPKSGRGK